MHQKAAIEEAPRKREKVASVASAAQLKNECQTRLLSLITKVRQKDEYGLFHLPVDPEEVPDYASIIKDPIDLQTMQQV